MCLQSRKQIKLAVYLFNSGKIKLSGKATRGRGGGGSMLLRENFILYHDKRAHIELSTDSTIWISKPASSTTIFHNYIWGQGIFHSSTKIMEQSTSDF